MPDIADSNSIKTLVDEFYNRVRQDDLLAPVFASVVQNNWQPHLEKMYAFWNAALFGVPGFKGNPFARHAPLPIQGHHFERWLGLFNQTVDAHFTGPVAQDAKDRAQLMGTLFQAKLSRIKDDFKKVLV